MDVSEIELPDPCQPACGLLQECCEAAGLRIDAYGPHGEVGEPPQPLP